MPFWNTPGYIGPDDPWNQNQDPFAPVSGSQGYRPWWYGLNPWDYLPVGGSPSNPSPNQGQGGAVQPNPFVEQQGQDNPDKGAPIYIDPVTGLPVWIVTGTGGMPQIPPTTPPTVPPTDQTPPADYPPGDGSGGPTFSTTVWDWLLGGGGRFPVPGGGGPPTPPASEPVMPYPVVNGRGVHEVPTGRPVFRTTVTAPSPKPEPRKGAPPTSEQEPPGPVFPPWQRPEPIPSPTPDKLPPWTPEPIVIPPATTPPGEPPGGGSKPPTPGTTPLGAALSGGGAGAPLPGEFAPVVGGGSPISSLFQLMGYMPQTPRGLRRRPY